MKRILFLALLIGLFNNNAFATHLRGGHISIKQLGKTSLTCRITITVYTETRNTSVLFGGTKFSDGDLLDFGDGSPRHLVPEIGPGKIVIGSTYSILDADRGVARATYTIQHTYSGSGQYIVSYREGNWNAGMLNFAGSVDTPFYLESSFILDPFSNKAYSSSDFLTEPLFRWTVQDDLSYSVAAMDSNNYQLLYELKTLKQDVGQDVLSYRLPESFTVNQFNGMIEWDTVLDGLSRAGEYGFAIKVYQIENDHVVGYVIRVFQIILEESTFIGTISDNRELDENNRIYIPNGNTFSFKVFAEDSDVTSIETFSELSSHSDLFSFESYDSTQGTQKIKVGVVSITSSAEILRDNPYAIVVRGSYQSGEYGKDLSYLFYTKDIEIPGLDVILSADVDELSISAYPNPIKDFLKIEGAGNKIKTIKLFSAQGELILEKKNVKEDSIDLRGVPAGIYILKVQLRGSQQKTLRVIKSE